MEDYFLVWRWGDRGKALVTKYDLNVKPRFDDIKQWVNEGLTDEASEEDYNDKEENQKGNLKAGA